MYLGTCKRLRLCSMCSYSSVCATTTCLYIACTCICMYSCNIYTNQRGFGLCDVFVDVVRIFGVCMKQHIQYASKKTSYKRAVQRNARSRSTPVQFPFNPRATPVQFPFISSPVFAPVQTGAYPFVNDTKNPAATAWCIASLGLRLRLRQRLLARRTEE